MESAPIAADVGLQTRPNNLARDCDRSFPATADIIHSRAVEGSVASDVNAEISPHPAAGEMVVLTTITMSLLAVHNALLFHAPLSRHLCMFHRTGQPHAPFRLGQGGQRAERRNADGLF